MGSRLPFCAKEATRAKSKTLKEAKKIDALLRQSDVLMKLQEMDKEGSESDVAG
jgi:hypothetical protein